MKNVLIVGATGSIGRQALDIIALHKDRFRVAGLSAHANEATLLDASRLCAREGLGAPALCLSGATPLDQSIAYAGTAALTRFIEDSDADIVLNAAAGADGLIPTMAALGCGKDLALANKESIVMAGRLVLALAKAKGARLLPVDSEHSALFNLIERFGRESIRGVIITASGGAFRDRPLESLKNVTPAEALAHPTWSMGAKITIDSATMANKGLEVLEAARLFNLRAEDIQVLIHPESRVHSFIRSREGSLYAQLSKPDMRLPILNALSWPDIVDENLADLDPGIEGLSFRPVDYDRYPLLALAYDALRAGEGAAIAYNAANEEAVAAFMQGRLPYLGIAAVVESCLERDLPALIEELPAILELDARARSQARNAITERT
ncbi:MAG TPA: 1-deoxy-D-xylulose-5-phosphate reductoisomerase [Spirochaetaceae bacterium]|nr:1-deoxy-D-xylulose-5-phosphate reductoisomerase [Spirochaetaceae bacterium]